MLTRYVTASSIVKSMVEDKGMLLNRGAVRSNTNCVSVHINKSGNIAMPTEVT